MSTTTTTTTTNTVVATFATASNPASNGTTKPFGPGSVITVEQRHIDAAKAMREADPAVGRAEASALSLAILDTCSDVIYVATYPDRLLVGIIGHELIDAFRVGGVVGAMALSEDTGAWGAVTPCTIIVGGEIRYGAPEEHTDGSGDGCDIDAETDPFADEEPQTDEQQAASYRRAMAHLGDVDGEGEATQ